jgi:hypothetical protein
MSEKNIPGLNGSVATVSDRFRVMVTQMTKWLAISLLITGPFSFLVFDDFGSVVWTLSMLVGFAVAITSHRTWWPAFRKNKTVMLFTGLLML